MEMERELLFLRKRSHVLEAECKQLGPARRMLQVYAAERRQWEKEKCRLEAEVLTLRRAKAVLEQQKVAPGNVLVYGASQLARRRPSLDVGGPGGAEAMASSYPGPRGMFTDSLGRGPRASALHHAFAKVRFTLGFVVQMRAKFSEADVNGCGLVDTSQSPVSELLRGLFPKQDYGDRGGTRWCTQHCTKGSTGGIQRWPTGQPEGAHNWCERMAPMTGQALEGPPKRPADEK